MRRLCERTCLCWRVSTKRSGSGERIEDVRSVNKIELLEIHGRVITQIKVCFGIVLEFDSNFENLEDTPKQMLILNSRKHVSWHHSVIESAGQSDVNSKAHPTCLKDEGQRTKVKFVNETTRQAISSQASKTDSAIAS